MERLKDIDEVAYVRFASVYRQFKDVNSFLDELHDMPQDYDESAICDGGVISVKKVLIVDDDPNISELLRLYFDKDGFAVVSCLDGNQAYDAFLRSSPDVVILDLMLPGRDGYDIMREIRKTSDVPILMPPW